MVFSTCSSARQTITTSNHSESQTGHSNRLCIHVHKVSIGQCGHFLHRHCRSHTDGDGSSCTFKVGKQVRINRNNTIDLRNRKNTSHSSTRRRKRKGSGSQGCHSRRWRSHMETCTEGILTKSWFRRGWHQTLFSQVRRLGLALVNR